MNNQELLTIFEENRLLFRLNNLKGKLDLRKLFLGNKDYNPNNVILDNKQLDRLYLYILNNTFKDRGKPLLEKIKEDMQLFFSTI